jgi:hypothetical protein
MIVSSYCNLLVLFESTTESWLVASIPSDRILSLLFLSNKKFSKCRIITSRQRCYIDVHVWNITLCKESRLLGREFLYCLDYQYTKNPLYIYFVSKYGYIRNLSIRSGIQVGTDVNIWWRYRVDVCHKKEFLDQLNNLSATRRTSSVV